MSNSKNSSFEHSEILKEIAIFNYVAGNLSKSEKQNFEKLLEQNPSLKEEVKAEEDLRRKMQKVGETKPVPMSNIDALFEKIDQYEQNSDKESQLESIQKAENVTPIFASKATTFSKYYATAASLAAVTILISGIYFSSTAPNFETLSDTPASQAINFTELANQNRIAKLTLVSGASDDQVSELLEKFGLTSFDSGAAIDQRFVISETELSKEAIDRLRKDDLIQSIELHKISDEK